MSPGPACPPASGKYWNSDREAVPPVRYNDVKLKLETLTGLLKVTVA